MCCVGVIDAAVAFARHTHTHFLYVARDGGQTINYIERQIYFIKELESCYPQIFSNKLGCFNKYKVKSTLKENSKPVFFKARPVAFALRDKVDK